MAIPERVFLGGDFGVNTSYLPVVSVTTSVVLSAGAYNVLNATNGNILATLPPVGAKSALYVSRDDNSAFSAAIATTEVGGTISGQATLALVINTAFLVVSDGNRYRVMASNALSADVNDTTLVTRVLYAGGAYPTRPPAVVVGYAEYVGPVQPTDWLNGDTWINNS